VTAPRSGIWQRVRGWGRRILQLDDTPESIARGVGLGIFIAMTPTVGIQMIIVTIVNTLARANRLAGILMVYISNPVTLVPIYWADYRIGCAITGTTPIGFQQFKGLFELQSSGFFSKFLEFVTKAGALGWDMVGPLFLGGAVLGVVCGVPAYFVTLNLVRKEQIRRAQKLAKEPAESKVE